MFNVFTYLDSVGGFMAFVHMLKHIKFYSLNMYSLL